MNIKDVRQKRLELEEELNEYINNKLTLFESECNLYIDGADIQVERCDTYIENIAQPILRSIDVKTNICIKL